jgi:hypothetical protein
MDEQVQQPVCYDIHAVAVFVLGVIAIAIWRLL